jgi:uncharacterized membrane protein YoaK (UPF0700 family)
MADSLPTHSSSSTPVRSSYPPNGMRKRESTMIRSRVYLTEPISTSYASIPLLVCCLISGLIDSVAYNAWTTFISMQTGNTIFLGLGASNQPPSKPYGWAKSLLSIGCFFIGCICFSHGMRALGSKGKTRGALLLSFFLQAGLMLAAAGLVQAHAVPVPPPGVALNYRVASQADPDFIELLPIGLLAFQGGGQLVASRLLGFNEIPTVVLTSVYCDLAIDEKLLVKTNEKRNHRIGAVVLILLGAIAGGWISRSEAGMAMAMWIAAVLKLGLAVAWILWKKEERAKE